MDYLSTVRVLDTDYKIKDEEAARINHTHKVEEIEGADKAASDAATAKTTANGAKDTADAAKSTADDAYSRTLRIELVSVPADNSNDTSQLIAYVYRGGELLSDQDVAKLGLIAWYVGGKRVATGSTYTCAAGTATECRLEA